MGEFEGVRALVTGGASGIGLATASHLRSLGATVAVLDRQSPPEESGIFTVLAELGDGDAVKRSVDLVARQLGGLDVLINNAGIGAQGTVEDNDDAQWHHVFDINVLGIVRATRAALPHLRASQHAAIVNTCSIAATLGLPQRALYSASKGAVLALTRAMAADLVGEGIRVNAVNPGTADTPWVERLLNSAVQPHDERIQLEARQPHGRLVSSDEVARAIAYLAAPTSGSTTGAALAVDGGMTGLRVRQGGTAKFAQRDPRTAAIRTVGGVPGSPTVATSTSGAPREIA
ncbi:SDR family oxidoreductase [Dactylosporangium sp. NPDC051484]|uniref:SDR family NAD(P)-dependent oxidoreductase n=1 Tax=Dactylosporangium sp. NPDC051484 TaxID=3154942 RepID=UPI00344B217C